MQLRQRRRGASEAFPDNGSGPGVEIVEERLAADSVEEGHREQWRHVGRIATILEKQFGNGHRRRGQRPNDAGLSQHVAVRDRRNSRWRDS